MKITNGKLVISTTKRQVWLGKKEIKLGKLEFDFLVLMAQYNKTALSRDEILTTIWEVSEPELLATRLVNNLVFRITQKLHQPFFRSVPGFGYAFDPPNNQSTLMEPEYESEDVQFKTVYQSVNSILQKI